ncbi:MAG: OmpA family protein [Flavobacterium sp.]|nr:OmpA family protein [Flavobacterium sp.]
MKKYLLFLTLSFVSFSINAQVDDDNPKITIFKRLPNDTINRWTLDFNVGQSKGINPYTAGYYSSNPNSYFGNPQVSHFGVATRYMFSAKMGFKLGLTYDMLRNNPNTSSLKFKMNVVSLSVEGVVNAFRLFQVEDSFGRLGLLFHGGLMMSAMTPNLPIADQSPTAPPGQLYNATEYNGGIVLGVTPQYRITKRIALFGDVTILNNYRQHLAWDGHYSADSNNLAGSLISYSGGMSFSLGQGRLHGDWAKIPDLKSQKEIDLEKRVSEVETLMNDTDRDGVPDYLDQENNSTAGVAVDSRGRMVDLNRNGVPDEMEKFLDSRYVNTNAAKEMNEDNMVKYINDGYAAAYFDFNDPVPTNVSTNGINFIWTYLKNNPTRTIDLVGYADEIGKSESNDALSKKRAENVKAILVKAGISPERMNIRPQGEDPSVNKDSEGARKLVRKVIFHVN